MTDKKEKEVFTTIQLLENIYVKQSEFKKTPYYQEVTYTDIQQLTPKFREVMLNYIWYYVFGVVDYREWKRLILKIKKDVQENFSIDIYEVISPKHIDFAENVQFKLKEKEKK